MFNTKFKQFLSFQSPCHFPENGQLKNQLKQAGFIKEKFTILNCFSHQNNRIVHKFNLGVVCAIFLDFFDNSGVFAHVMLIWSTVPPPWPTFLEARSPFVRSMSQ